MSEVSRNKQIDADILQCKADILRARDIIPPYKKKTHPEAKSENNSADAAENAAKKENESHKGTSSIPMKTTEHKEERPAKTVKVNKKEPVKTPELEQVISSQENIPDVSVEQTTKPVKRPREQGEIPRFNLAEDIMAEQRKITTIRRKGPSPKIETQKEEPEVIATSYTVERLLPALPEQDQIIAEIVAKDIEKMCRGDYSANGR